MILHARMMPFWWDRCQADARRQSLSKTIEYTSYFFQCKCIHDSVLVVLYIYIE